MDPFSPDPSRPAYARLFTLAAHELRTPVSVVGGYLRMLQRGDTSTLSDGQRRIIEEAAKSCDRLTALVAELSDLGKLDAGLLPLTRTPADLFSIAELAAAEAVQDSNDARIELRGPAAGGPIQADVARLRAAVATLVRTALREHPSEKSVIVDRRTVDGRQPSAVVLIGIETEVGAALDAVREPIDEGRGGLGLALPIARRVIELHGGMLAAAANPGAKPGRGAFIVSLHADRETPASRPKSRADSK